MAFEGNNIIWFFLVLWRNGGKYRWRFHFHCKKKRLQQSGSLPSQLKCLHDFLKQSRVATFTVYTRVLSIHFVFNKKFTLLTANEVNPWILDFSFLLFIKINAFWNSLNASRIQMTNCPVLRQSNFIAYNFFNLTTLITCDIVSFFHIFEQKNYVFCLWNLLFLSPTSYSRSKRDTSFDCFLPPGSAVEMKQFASRDLTWNMVVRFNYESSLDG